MSIRLQVVIDEADAAGFRAAATRSGLTLSEWVRRALREAEQATSPLDPSARLRAVLAAAEHEFPAPDIEVMLSEIEAGRGL